MPGIPKHTHIHTQLGYNHQAVLRSIPGIVIKRRMGSPNRSERLGIQARRLATDPTPREADGEADGVRQIATRNDIGYTGRRGD
jgi:hypothetical protein